jgi:orotidine-5'-phosphate decarboxylase
VDGVVASPLEARVIRSTIAKPDFLIVTPGIRPSNGERDDQKRVMTPQAALNAGANYLVVGRPVTSAKDPAAAAQAILDEMKHE